MLFFSDLYCSFLEGGEVDLATVGRVLYSWSVRRLGQGRTDGVVSETIFLLLQAGCLGDNHTLHLASVIYNYGLGVSFLPSKVCACVDF